MSWELTTDVERFASVAGDFLRSEPVRNTVFLTVIGTLRRQKPMAYDPSAPLFGWWTTDTGEVGGALMQTTAYPVMFSELPPEAVPAAVEALATRSLTGVNMLEDDAAAFTAGWQARTGATGRTRMHTRLFRLDRLVLPEPAPPGSARSATALDRPLLIDWFRAFNDLVSERAVDIESQVDHHLESGGAILWQDGGVPVAMAARSRPEAGMVRVQAVYTPVEHQRRGYGGGVTTAATRAALDDGATEVVLFTDLGNPTSNALYQRLGYRPIEDRATVEFDA